MLEGWKLFLHNLLQLHLAHFAGQPAVPSLPMVMAQGPRAAAWSALASALGLPSAPSVGDRIEVSGEGVPPLAGTVPRSQPGMVSLLLDEPAPGTGFLAVEGDGEQVSVSVWLYLYGPDAAAVAERDEPRGRAWLESRFPAPA